jgi:hypothetical protein
MRFAFRVNPSHPKSIDPGVEPIEADNVGCLYGSR